MVLAKDTADHLVNLLIDHSWRILRPLYHILFIEHVVESLLLPLNRKSLQVFLLSARPKGLWLLLVVMAKSVQLFEVGDDLFSDSDYLDLHFLHLLGRFNFKCEEGFLEKTQSWSQEECSHQPTYPSNHVNHGRSTIVNEAKLV